VSGSIPLKIGVSGVRGVVGAALTPQLVTSFAAAYGTYTGPGRIVIGTDTRPSREMVTQAVLAGLMSVGCTPVFLGIVPAPTLQHHVRALRAVGGICVTASHNPAEWNALEFIGPDGVVLRPNQFAELLDLYHQGSHPRVGAEDIPELEFDDSAVARHEDSVRASVDVEVIARRRLDVVIDCCNGAASRFAPEFLERLGCRVTAIHADPDRPFPRDPEPNRGNIGDLCARVRESKADLGFALDADADRVAIVDEAGRAIGEDLTLAIVVEHALAKRPGPVVVNRSTSRVIESVAERFGSVVHRTKVGEVHVVERMLRVGARIGGEGNGGVILLEVNPCRDSFVGMSLVLEALANSGETVAERVSRFPAMTMLKRKIPCRGRDVAPAIRLLKRVFHGERQDLTDGLAVLWSDRWFHVRGSNTETAIRVCAEAPNRSAAEELIERVLEFIRPFEG
jgi:phosphomannomutase